MAVCGDTDHPQGETVMMKPLTAPLILYWALTAQCNMNCRHCYAATDTEPSELTAYARRQVLSDIRSAGVLQVYITGGEPLCRPDIADVVAEARLAGFGVCLATNGALLTPELARQFRRLEVSHIRISLDGATPQSHDMMRRCPGALGSAIAAVRMLVDAGIPAAVNTVVTDETSGELEQMRDLLAQLKVRSWTVTVPADTGRGGRIQASAPTVQRVLDTIGRQAAGWEPRPRLDEPLSCRTWRLERGQYPLITPQACGAGRHIIAMGPDGSLTPCIMDRTVVGRLPDMRLIDVWRSSVELGLLRSGRDRLTGTCGECSSASSCGGGCRAHVKISGGGRDGSDDQCLGTGRFSCAPPA